MLVEQISLFNFEKQENSVNIFSFNQQLNRESRKRFSFVT